MGPGVRRDDGLKANNIKTVTPAKAGAPHLSPKYAADAYPYNTASLNKANIK